MKNFDASSLPPSQSELYQHLLRARYITNIWLNAHKPVPTELDPKEHGWEVGDDNTYTFKWFEGPQLPESVRDVLESESDNEMDDFECESDEDDECEQSDNDNDNCTSDDDF